MNVVVGARANCAPIGKYVDLLTYLPRYLSRVTFFLGSCAGYSDQRRVRAYPSPGRRAEVASKRAPLRSTRIARYASGPVDRGMVLLTTNQLGGLVASFSVTHIGMSAIREPLIDRLGAAAARVGAVGLGISLPSIWLADSSGLEVWPNEATAGRQLYRAGYTVVSSALLFPALAAYPEARAAAEAAAASTALSPSEWWLCFAAATGAQAISIASLLNPSPLSLVPGFEADETALGGVKRDDRLKLRPYGLTRITRHPLILPVVPWGAANALLAGAQ